MLRQTPSRRLRLVALAVASGLMLASAALAATSTAPEGTYGGYGGYGSTAPSDGFGSDEPSGQPDDDQKPKKQKKKQKDEGAR